MCDIARTSRRGVEIITYLRNDLIYLKAIKELSLRDPACVVPRVARIILAFTYKSKKQRAKR